MAEDLPQNCRDTKFLRSHFIGTVAPRIPREKASGLLPKGDYLMQVRDNNQLTTLYPFTLSAHRSFSVPHHVLQLSRC